MSWNAPGPEDRLSTSTLIKIAVGVSLILGVVAGLVGGFLYFCYVMFGAFAH